MKRVPLKERFDSRFIVTPSCWLWRGRLDPEGYGRIDEEGQSLLAHRVSASFYVPSYDESLKILHKCDNTRCVNPDHLRQGTQIDNIADRVAKGRYARGETSGSAKLTALQVLEIRARFIKGAISKSELARQYGVTSQYMGRLLRSDKWKHLGR